MNNEADTNGETKVNEKTDYCYGMAYQRDDMLFDVYVSDEDVFDKGTARWRDERPSLVPIAEGIHLCKAKRLMLDNRCARSRIKFRFVDKKTRLEKMARDFKEKFGISRQEVHNLVMAKHQYEKVIAMLGSLPSGDELAKITKHRTMLFRDLDGQTRGFADIAEAVLGFINKRISDNEEAVKCLGI